jgi:DNA polymerase IIIc chi subunit
MYSIREPILFLCDNEEEVDFYNSRLWTFSRLSFIPSGNKKALPIEDAKFCHVWFSTEIVFYNNPYCLLHNGIDITKFGDISSFNKVIDIFDLNLIDNAKARAAYYKNASFLEQKTWVQNDSSWKPAEL